MMTAAKRNTESDVEVDVRREIQRARTDLVTGRASDSQIALVYMANRMGEAWAELDDLLQHLRGQFSGLNQLLAMGIEKRVAKRK